MEDYEESSQEILSFVAINLWEIISSKDKPLEKLEKTIEGISRFFGIEKCSLMVKDKYGKFIIVASKGIPRKIKDETETCGSKGIADMAIEEKKAIFMKKIGGVGDKEERNYKTDNFISYPVIINGEVKGVLNLTDKIGERGFSDRDIEAVKPIVERIKFILEELFRTR